MERVEVNSSWNYIIQKKIKKVFYGKERIIEEDVVVSIPYIVILHNNKIDNILNNNISEKEFRFFPTSIKKGSEIWEYFINLHKNNQLVTL